jgi:NAD(P)-dependent dehydrogenase (short-subunit alcohol dehydrogenase family)
LALAEAGADLVLHCRQRSDQANRSLLSVQELGHKAVLLEADLDSEQAVKDLCVRAVEALGGIDILVSNVAIQHSQAWDKITPDAFDEQIRTNFKSALILIQELAPAMIENKWGRIVCIGSVQEAYPRPDMLVYAATKCAQTSMVENLARVFAPHGVTVNNLAPGAIPTDRNKEVLSDPKYKKRVLAAIPCGYLGEPEDCAGTALLLCSDAGRYITGQSLFVDGGMSLP